MTTLCSDGRTTVDTFKDDPPLDWLMEKVGGWIELVPGHPQIYVNEDAIRFGLPVNELAAKRLGAVLGTVDGKLRGNVVIVEPMQ